MFRNIGIVWKINMENSTNLFKYKVGGMSGFVLVLLVLVLVGLGERVLYDISRIFVGSQFNYFNDLSTLMVHTLFVMLLIIVAVVVNIAVAEKKTKYAIVLIPYFVMAIALTMQVAIEAAVYFYFHHTQFEFYLVMSALVIVSSMLIYFVQKRYVPIEASISTGSGSGGHTVFVWVLGVVLGVPLLLYIIGMFLFRAF